MTKTKPPKALPPLGDLEHEVANLIWTHGPMTAASVRKLLPRPLKDPTIRTVLRRLEEKGYFTHELEHGAFMCPSSEYLRHGGVFRNGGSGSSGVSV